MNDASIPLSKEMVSTLESAEVCAFASLFGGTPPALADQFGIGMLRFGSALLTSAAQFDVLLFNRVVGLGLDEPISPRQIDAIMQEFVQRRVKRYFVQLQPLADTPETRALLVARGFVAYNNWVRLRRDVTPVSGVTSDLRVSPIGLKQAEDFARIVIDCFAQPPAARPWIQTFVGQPGWQFYMAYDGERPVAAAGLFINGRDAWIGFAATLPEYRGHGAQAALLHRRIEDARAAGCEQIVVETAQQTADHEAPSYRNMLRYGFTEMYLRPNYIYRNA